MLGFRTGRQVSLVSRNQKMLNGNYPELVDALAQQRARQFIVDGEVVAFAGRQISFSRLQQRMQLRDPEAARRSGVAVYYYLFDLLYLDGYDLSDLELGHRKALLKQTLDFRGPLRHSAHRVGRGESFYREACRRGWEGLIAKRVDGRYVHRHSTDWLKFKCVGKRLEELQREESPFARTRGMPERGVPWVSPTLVAEVAFTEWTRDGRLRHPRFLGLRRDKDPREVIREKPV